MGGRERWLGARRLAAITLCVVYAVGCGAAPAAGGSATGAEPAGGAVAAPTPTAPRAPPNDPLVRELYRQAYEAVQAQRWAEGCKKFEAVATMTLTAAVLINLGDCKAHDGKLASAYADYLQARVLNPATQPEERRIELDGEIQKRLSGIEPRLPRVAILAANVPPGAVVKQDGRPLPEGALGSELPVDPGAHEVTVEAPGFVAQRYPVSLNEGERRTVQVELTVREESGAARYKGTIAAGSVAVTLGAVGLALGGWTVSTHPDLRKRCAEGEAACKDEAAALAMRGTVTNVFLGLAGAAAVTAGVVFLAVERPKAPSVAVGVSGTGASLRVRW